MNEKERELEINKKGLNAPRLTPEMVSDKIISATYTRLPSGKKTICEITLQNGFTVIGEASTVSKENFNQELAEKISFKNAREKVWLLEAYLLQESLVVSK